MASDSIYKNKPENYNASYPTPTQKKKTKKNDGQIIITCISIVHSFVTNRLQFKGNGNIASQMWKADIAM